MMANAAAVGQTKSGRNIFLVLLFCSGFASLMYEVIWTRVLLSVFGATVYASGTVLTSFMFGLALGSWLVARYGGRIRLSPLKLYAFLELGIGVYALLFPMILAGVNSAHVSAFAAWGNSFYLISLMRFALAFLILAIPATLMGATLPIITRFGVKTLASLGTDLGKLYSVNTVGAALGTFCTGFLFIELLGIRTSTYVAVVLDLAVFVGALALSRRVETAETTMAEPADVKSAPVTSTSDSSAGNRRLVLLVLAISGCCALAYEVLWARILVYVLGNFVHSFSIMLTAFLTGIAIGSYTLGRASDRMSKPWAWLAVCQVVIGVAAILSLPLFMKLIVFRDSVLDSLASVSALADYKDPWWQFTAWKISVTFLFMFVPTFCMGASFPLATRLYIKDLSNVSKGVGTLYAGNTLGAIVGSFCASFFLIPWIGIRNATLVLAALNLAAACLLVTRYAAGGKRWQPMAAWAGAAVVVVIAVLAVPATIFHPIYASAEKGKRLVHVEETVSGTLSIHETPNGFKVIDINGLNVAGTKFGFHCTQKLQAHFPLLMHPNPRNVMQIGFGTGGTCYSVSLHPEVERIDCVEINAGVPAAAHFFEDVNHGIYKPGADPRVNLTIEDARNFVQTTTRKYDLVLSDSIHPRFTGNGLLYTRDYYELCAEILNERGIHSTWLPTAFLGADEFKIIIRTMQSVFPHILIWYMNNTVEGYTIVMGSREPFEVGFRHLVERMNRPALHDDLAQVHIGNAYDLLDCVAMGEEKVTEYLGEGLLNTEDRPIIEFRAPRSMNRVVTEYLNLQGIMEHRAFPLSILGNEGLGHDREMAQKRLAVFKRFFDATTYILAAHQAHLLSQVDREIELLNKAVETNPNDKDAPFLLQRLENMETGGRVDW